MPPIIALRALQPLARGHKRLVYQHPLDDDLLIKVMSHAAGRRWGAGARWYKLERRPGIYLGFYREVGEYLCVRATLPGPPPFIQRIVGFVETDLGLGLVVEKLRDQEGRLAPQLRSLVLRGGFSEEVARELDRLTEALLAHDVVLAKLNVRNVLRAWDASGSRLVIIDGFGSKLAIPIDRLSKRVNRMRTLRKARTLRADIDKLLAGRPAPA